MNKPLLTFVIDPVIALGSSIAIGIRTGFYSLVGQSVAPPTEWATNITSTGLLAGVIWFLLVRLQKSIDDNTAATRESANQTREMADAIKEFVKK